MLAHLQRLRPPFSWWGLLLAPVPVPLLCAFWFSVDSPRPLGLFALSLPVGLLVSYSATLFLLLPCMGKACRWVRPSPLRAAALGLLLGLGLFLGFAWVGWCSSGPDSGPPNRDVFRISRPRLL